MDAVEKAKSGHPGMPMGMADIATVLYKNHLKFDPIDPNWIDRDRLILSKGHGCLALYAILADKEFFKMEELDNFCEPKSILGGHPERDKIPGVEASTGALGHGPAIGLGMAIAARLNKIKANSPP